MSTSVTDWFGGAKRVMFVHAHPDDETITTGGTLAALADHGLEPLVVTLTRGEQGEVMTGPLAHLAGTDSLAPHRQAELSAALAMLGVQRHAFLGVEPARAAGLQPTIYEDSGMQWLADGVAGPGPDASADALTVVPAVESLSDLLAAAHDAQAGAIVSYDATGGYGHPDHVHAHRIARAVATALQLPFYEIVEGQGPTGEAGEQDGVELYDVTPWLDRKVIALRAYQTQLTVDGDDIVHVGGQRQAITAVEGYRFIAAPE